jgi:hypothetical protein
MASNDRRRSTGRTGVCPACARVLTLRRAAFTADPGFRYKPYVVPWYKDKHGLSCAGAGASLGSSDTTGVA